MKYISIHLMLLFNAKEVGERLSYLNFNTSNVTIQQASYPLGQVILQYFNTSNVTIQQTGLDMTGATKDYFNTSNVTIQPTILSHLFYSQFHYTHYISTFS